MNRGTNIALLVVAGVIAIVANRWLFARSELVEAAPAAQSASFEGEVISVDTDSTGGRPRLRHALVKLLSGERVEAVVPIGCSVLPGQVTRVTKRERGADPSYMVVENGK